MLLEAYDEAEVNRRSAAAALEEEAMSSQPDKSLKEHQRLFGDEKEANWDVGARDLNTTSAFLERETTARGHSAFQGFDQRLRKFFFLNFPDEPVGDMDIKVSFCRLSRDFLALLYAQTQTYNCLYLRY